jgi:hypothetical protein
MRSEGRHWCLAPMFTIVRDYSLVSAYYSCRTALCRRATLQPVVTSHVTWSKPVNQAALKNNRRRAHGNDASHAKNGRTLLTARLVDRNHARQSEYPASAPWLSSLKCGNPIIIRDAGTMPKGNV